MAESEYEWTWFDCSLFVGMMLSGIVSLAGVAGLIFAGIDGAGGGAARLTFYYGLGGFYVCFFGLILRDKLRSKKMANHSPAPE